MSVTGDMWCLWICLHDCDINSSGLLIVSQTESRNMLLIAIPLKCLCCLCGKKKKEKKKSGMQTVLEHWHCYCLLYWAMATTRTGSWGISTLKVLSAMFQPKMHLTGRWWQEMLALKEKCSPQGKGEEIKILSALEALWSERISSQRDFFPFRERLLLFVSTKWWWTITFYLGCYLPVIHQSFSSSGNCMQSPLTLSHGPKAM